MHYVTTCGPPDISCADISAEQIARTYSHIWDPKTNPVPPMQPMEGFGRFRRSIHADADWQLSRYRGDLQRLGPVAIEHLGDFEIARLQRGVMDNIRSPSYVSLAAHSDPGPSSGPRVYRGFTPSRSFSISQTQNEQTGSLTEGGFHGSVPTLREPTRSNCRIQSQRSFLMTIDEAAANLERKKIVPLTFHTNGLADEAIDDDEYESCEDTSLPAGVSGMGAKIRPAPDSSKVLERKERDQQTVAQNRSRTTRSGRNLEMVPDKGRACHRKQGKSMARRFSSRTRKSLVNLHVAQEHVQHTNENKVVAVAAQAVLAELSKVPTAILISKESEVCSDDSADDDPVDLGIFMVEQRAPTPPSKSFGRVISAVQNDWKSVPCRFSAALSKGNDTLGTGLRVRSGNIPRVRFED
jgi:hypothetical protein